MTKLADLKTIQRQVNDLAKLVDGMVTAELKAQVPPEVQREQQAKREKEILIDRLRQRIDYLKAQAKDSDYKNDARRNLESAEQDLKRALAG